MKSNVIKKFRLGELFCGPGDLLMQQLIPR